MYDFRGIEKKWQKIWEEKKLWRANDSSKKRKYYALVEFPYPSGEGLHVGHARSYTALDVIARKRRMEGYNVLYPMGWDAFGLPTEQYAIKTNTAPQKVTEKNIRVFKRQLKSMGFSFDWQREINTTDPNYYKWTQWVFIQLFKHGLAYKDSSYIHWCSSCKIGLANEEVVGGRCERCGGPVEKKMRKQWFLKITAYVDKLLKGLDSVDYLEEIKAQQRNWIGRSEGKEIEFPIVVGRGRKAVSKIKVFTTRPDTIDGATYLVLAPEYPLNLDLVKNKAVVKRYIGRAKEKTDLERQENKEKTGVELRGLKAINPFNNEKISIWISDYVLMQYGTGAIMAVPQHDERDLEFAEKHKLSIVDRPLVPKRKWPGKTKIYYKLRDWVFSRQRYWGEPIPIINCEKCGYVPVPEKDLPVKLPKIDKFQPRSDGKSPLASAARWIKVKCPTCSGAAQRETDVMPNWAGSSWYYLAYAGGLKSKSLKHWMPVDWYNGGMEHTTLHLLYSRFWNQFLNDIDVAPYSEPYKKRTSHGMILGENREKMSKSKGNVVNPDDLVREFGADALRLCEMFIGPFRDSIAWNPRGIVGTQRFLNKVHNLRTKLDSRLRENDRGSGKELEKLVHQTIKKVSEDMEEMKFNTAISSLMVLVNKMEEVSVKSAIPISHFIILLKLLFPFAPHLAQELWGEIRTSGVLKGTRCPRFVDQEEWPEHDPKLVAEETFELIVQVDGKTRATLTARKGIAKEEAEASVVKLPIMEKRLKNKKITKIIFVPDRLINFILS